MYLIEHKIKTLTQLWDPWSYGGFDFRQWNFTFGDGPVGKAWIARKIVVASDATMAINNFRNELFPIVDKISFISQCFATVEVEPFMILKQNSNPDNVFYLWYSRERDGVPLHFGEEEQDSMLKLSSYDKNHIFRYLREGNNSLTFNTRFAMLVAALEGIAGQRKDGDKISTDKEYIKTEILKDDNLFDKIFAYGDGIRNQLFHGSEIKVESGEPNYVDTLYEKIRAYFNNKHATRIDGGVVGTPRTPYGNYEAGKLWLQPVESGKVPDLKWAVEACDYDFHGIGRDGTENRITNEKLIDIHPMPPNY